MSETAPLAPSTVTPTDHSTRQSARHPGAAIRALRRQRRLTLVQLSELSGVSFPFLSQIENQRSNPSDRSLAAIATALGTTVEHVSGTADALATVRLLPGDPRRTSGNRILSSGGQIGVIEVRRDSGECEDLVAGPPDTILYVVAGVVEVFTESETPVLHPGDGLHCSGSAAQRWTALVDGTIVLRISCSTGLLGTGHRAIAD